MERQYVTMVDNKEEVKPTEELRKSPSFPITEVLGDETGQKKEQQKSKK